MKTVTVLSLLAALAQAHPTQERASEKAVRAPHPGTAHQLDRAGGFGRAVAEKKRTPQGWGQGGGYGGWWGNFPGAQQSSAAPTAAATPVTAPTATSNAGRVAAASSTSAATSTCMFMTSKTLVYYDTVADLP